MRRVLLDSDIFSEIIRGVNPVVAATASAYVVEHNVLSFSSATALELLYGLHCKSATAQIKRVLNVFAQNDEVHLAPEDYRLGAEIAGAVTRRGRPIGLLDPLIAACAINHGYGVSTGNNAHFEYIRQAGFAVHLENWRERF